MPPGPALAGVSTVHRVNYWVYNYQPQWEAVSKEIASLRDGLTDTVDASLISLNTMDRSLRLRGREKRFPLPHAVPLLPLVLPQAARGDINHLFASAGERYLTPVVARRNGVLTVAKDAGSLQRVQRNAAVFPSYRAVVVQCERDRDLLRQLGVDGRSLRLIRPGIPLAPHREGEGPFTILFASSPFTAADFLSRGVYLMLRAAARLPDIRFLLVWRERHLARLRQLIDGAGVTNVEILNGLVRDMDAVYGRVHATILAGLEHRSFIPAPRSGLESLAHGKPLLASHFVAIADSVAAAGAGVAFMPTVEGLEDAILRLRRDYAAMQARAQPYIRDNFCPTTHLELYRRLYRAVGP
jgi:glycosyltransferase involved in cell wall biosynthesis